MMKFVFLHLIIAVSGDKRMKMKEISAWCLLFPLNIDRKWSNTQNTHKVLFTTKNYRPGDFH